MTYITWPAYSDFKKQRGRKLPHVLIWECLTETHKIDERFDLKIEALAMAIESRRRETVIAAVNDLVRWGYLTAHGRAQRNVRVVSINRIKTPVAA